MKKIIFLLCALALVLGAVWAPVFAPAMGEEGAALFPPAFVIDPGHGGEDGGAVSLSGHPESEINLAIALRLEWLLALYGFPVEMTREEDISIHDPQAETLREKKVSDLKNRAALVEAQPQAMLISIHQNTFPDPWYSGAQVFYGGAEGSRDWALAAQELLRQALDPSNTRQAKPIPGTVYLMEHVSCPAILVECGFLSNPTEDLMLIQPQYQLKVAAGLAAACLSGWEIIHEGENTHG